MNSIASKHAILISPPVWTNLFALVVLSTNTMIDLGFVFAALVPLILSVAGCSYEVIWRTSFAIGVLPRKG